MQNPPPDIVPGYPGGSVRDKDGNLESNLGTAYSPVDYMSITSFPRLPEEDMLSGDNTLKSRKDDDNVLSEQETDPDLFLKSARLQRIPSSASDLANQDIASLRETTRDPFKEKCACQRDGLTVIVTACLTFATGVTIALIMQIYVGDPQVFNQGAVVTDVAQCTSVGLAVLRRQGSSVDAAISAALCQGIIHPHTSGIGGGGVMLVHDIRKNETKVIDFKETAPSAIREEMLRENLNYRPGLLVGVPGMLSGLHRAYQLYGRMPWRDVISMAADVARNGFNITHDLAEALANVKEQNMSSAFRDLFLPNGQTPLPGTFSRRIDLAAILDAVADNGISDFYSGNLSLEIAAAVQAAHGVLSEEDFRNYTTLVMEPAQGNYQGHHVMVPAAPHAGMALITALNILEGFNITKQVPVNITYHWIAESLKIALGLASGLGDPKYDPSVLDIVTKMLSKSQASLFRQMINDTQAYPVSHYTSSFSLDEGAVAAQVTVMGPDDFIVSVMSSLNKPFGSGIVTTSGVLLNSQILDFSWPNKTQGPSLPNPHNSIQPGKRPMSFLMPTAVRPVVGQCGTYVAVASSNRDRSLSGITEVLMNVLSYRKNMNDSVAFGRLHPQLELDTLLVDSEFPEDIVETLQAKGHSVERRDVLSLVAGTRRRNDLIIGVKDARSADSSALSMSTMP